MKLKIAILTIVLFGCSPKETAEELALVAEYKIREHHRVWKSEYEYNKKDSLFSKNKYFNAFDSNNRLINKNNIIFYEYNDLGKIIEEKSIYHRDRIIKVTTVKYLYDENQKLKHKIRLNEKLDTILTNKYNSNGQITQSKNQIETIRYTYNKENLIKKTTFRNGSESRISNYEYDSIGRLAIDNWIFSGANKMKTTFKYDEKNLLIEEIDSSYSIKDNPNSFVEFKTEYKYNAEDSIVEIRKLGRVVSESEFKLRGKTIIEYKIE